MGLSTFEVRRFQLPPDPTGDWPSWRYWDFVIDGAQLNDWGVLELIW
jgi:hypothetical protein